MVDRRYKIRLGTSGIRCTRIWVVSANGGTNGMATVVMATHSTFRHAIAMALTHDALFT